MADEKNIKTPGKISKISRRALLSSGLVIPFIGLPIGLPWPANAKARKTAIASAPPIHATEDGYRAWLRYNFITDGDVLQKYRGQISSLLVESTSPTANIVRDELTTALAALLGKKVDVASGPTQGSIVVATAKSSIVSKLVPAADLEKVGNDGFIITTVSTANGPAILIASNTDVGTLYGAFAFLRLLQTHRDISKLSIIEKATHPLRILAHWDNPDGSIERGYAGRSLWRWDELPGYVDTRLNDYARLNASIGINGVVINNVNADPHILSTEQLPKVKALADRFRPYGLRVYVCANFGAPCALGGLPSADPLEPKVIDWWHNKADEIYKVIPDFGGFLVKANSEGLPGPQDYNRTHADGANLLAGALAPHGGIVMWRAFVYTVGNQNQDRVKRAYIDFKPLDGKFADNVLLQVKNGPLDFQPREPFHPLFGAMPKTRVIGELQITQEYTGQSTHLVYLASLWKEVLDSNTYNNGPQSSVAQIIEGLPSPGRGGLSAGANVGSDRNWCGHHFAQANWYAYGRLCWDNDLSAAAIAEDWIKMTWSNAPPVVTAISRIMLESYEAYVNYTMPLGLHHMVGGDHYAPLPEGEGDPRGIFHHAAADGIGYDRTRETGSDAVDEYHSPLNDIFNDPAKCPEKYLLWFHHLPWNHRMASGRTLWQELCFKYATGIKVATEMERQWAGLAPEIDSQRHNEVLAKLHRQAQDAKAWSDKCLNYFAQYSKLPRTQ